MAMKKIYYLLYIVIGIYCVSLLISGKIWFMISYLLLLGMTKYYSVKRNEELNYMWQLAKEKNIPLITLSELSNMGQLDLKATQREESGRYLPSRQLVRQTIEKLENYKG